MSRARIRVRRPALVTSVASLVVVALCTAFAVASSGYEGERANLDDASVWVTNDKVHAVGRANTAVGELNSVLELGTDVELVQRGATVLSLDTERAKLGVIDPATSQLSDTIALPPKSPSVAIAGSRVVIASDGDVWTTPIGDLLDFDSERDPALSLGPGTKVAVDRAGTMVAYTPSTGVVVRVDAAHTDAIGERWQAPIATDTTQLTSVAGEWAVFDEEARQLYLDSHVVDLHDVLTDGTAVKLQEPSLSGDSVALATERGLVMVPLDGSAITTVVERRAGAPARPFEFDGCLYAAWSDGTAWQSCAPDPVSFVEGAGAAGLQFAENGGALVLNDTPTGRTWIASGSYELVDNWDELVETTDETQTIEQNDPDVPPSYEKSQVPPVAENDSFGARPGRSTVLPVLLNDSDANGDALVVAPVAAELPEWASLARISRSQQLLLTLDDEATGSVQFEYTVDDGRGGSAVAAVDVTIRAPDENSAPVQVRPTSAALAVGGRLQRNVLGDWMDPDGDPMFLLRAEGASEDAISTTPEGIVTFDDGRAAPGARTVVLAVSDGRSTGSGELDLAVRAAGDVPLITEPFVELATSGEEITIDPLAHVRGGTGEIRLTAVPAKPDAEVTTDFDSGVFRFSSTVARTHYLEYSASDGTSSVTGLIRVDVSEPPTRDLTPITVPHTAFARAGQVIDVDVLDGDIDPSGGVLVITGLDEPTRTNDELEAAGVRVEIVQHRTLRVTLDKPLETGSIVFGYRVSNGLAEAAGQVTVVEMPDPERTQPPVAAPDTISVRTGGAVDVRVLENDAHPDGLALDLAPELVAEPDAGLMFASGNRLRYLAPEAPGEYLATYRVYGPDRQFATADVRLLVREPDAETNSAPVPPTVTARVLAGETVRIPIPLDGADPDGDTVQLLGEDSNPERGAVVARGADWLEYRAGEYSTGTDTFSYLMIDSLGARANGTVRVGISAPPDGARAPIAVEDHVIARPGRTLSVRVLANDSDPGGGALRITDVEATTPGATAEIVDDAVVVRLPDDDASYGFIYSIENERLGTASSFLSIDARDDAPLTRPEVDDTELGLSDILENEVVTVPVLENAFIADASVGDAVVGLVPGYESTARVGPRGTIRVSVENSSQIIPFSVAHPDDPDLVAHAFIWVPGLDDALPQLRRGAKMPSVVSGEKLDIELADFVIAASGRPVQITDAAAVRATHASGDPLVIDRDTLRFQSEPGYFGPASISFTATDGAADDPDARTGPIVISIEVLPTTDQPPTFVGGVIDFEPGATKQISLRKLTSSPTPGTLESLDYRVLDPVPLGFAVALDGAMLSLTAEPGAAIGESTAVSIGVRNSDGAGTGGRIELRVVPSTRPIAQPADDVSVAERGTTKSIDVLANDAPTNPFPATPLKVRAVRGLGEALPAGITVVPSSDRSKLRVAVASNAAPVNTTLQYQVADATGDPSRYAWGRVTISVQDRPDPITDLRVTGYANQSLSVAFGAGAFNNSPITGYRIALRSAVDDTEVSSTSCEATTCTIPTPGNGRDNAVRVSVQAVNSVGSSDAQTTPDSVWSDVVPPAPRSVRAVPLDGRLRIEWPAVPPGDGSSIRSYVLAVAGASAEVAAGTACSAGRCSFTSQPLANGSQVAFTVSARNDAYPALSTWNTASGAGTPYGAPVAGAMSVSADPAAGSATVEWAPFGANGDAIEGYYVQRLAAGASGVPTGPQACRVSSPAPGTVTAPSSGGSVAETIAVGPGATSVRFAGTGDEAKRYEFVVWGYNRAGCAHTEVVGVVVRPAPGAVSDVQSRMDWLSGETWDRYVSSVTAPASRLEIVAVDENGTQVPPVKNFAGDGWLREVLARPFGTTAKFQVRSCTAWGSCGPWSKTMPSGASPSLTFALPGRSWNSDASTWSWTASPKNSGLPAQLRCGLIGDDVGVLAQSSTSCTIPDAAPDSDVWLDVDVAGVTARFQN